MKILLNKQWWEKEAYTSLSKLEFNWFCKHHNLVLEAVEDELSRQHKLGVLWVTGIAGYELAKTRYTLRRKDNYIKPGSYRLATALDIIAMRMK